MSEAPHRRRVSTEPEGAEERSGCLRIAAILGIVLGIPAGVFGLPAALNYFFDETTVEAGGRYEHDALEITVVSTGRSEGPPRTVTITLAVLARESWQPLLRDFELELASGDRITAGLADPSLPQLAAGEETTFALRFSLTEAQEESAPLVLHLTDPKVRFELPEPLP